MAGRWFSYGALAALFVGLAAGCAGQDKPVRVSGVLLWEDGTPVDSATVVFMPEKEGARSAAGFTGKDGTFDLTTFNSGDGALPGVYKVVVTHTEVADTGAGQAGAMDPTKAMQEWQKNQGDKKPKPKNAIPAIYNNEKNTPLKWTVESGGPRAELKLKKV